MLNVEGSSPFARSIPEQPLAFRCTLNTPTRWVFQLNESSFQGVNGICPITEEIKSVFPTGFIPEQKASRVLFRFEDEKGFYWGGEDIHLEARFEEFFGWEWVDSRDGSKHPNRLHHPAWFTLRAWQMLRSMVSRRSWDSTPNSDLTLEIMKARGLHYMEGVFQEHGYPTRLILTLK